VAFIEVSEGKREPLDYVERFGTGRLPFDFIWFTPAAQREDLCEKLRKRMEQRSRPPSKP
jgi:hypothetical protein